MRNIILANTYLDSYENLSKKQRKIVRNSIKQFAMDERGNSFKVHKLDKENCDPSFRSARMNDNIRLIFSLQEDRYILLYVDNHDNAYTWARNKFFHQNFFNSIYIYDQSVEVQNKTYQEENNNPLDYIKGILEQMGIQTKDLEKLGLTEAYAKILLECFKDEEFLQLITVLPEELQEVLLELYTGQISMTEAYALLTDSNSTEENVFDNSSSRSRFYTVEDEKDLDRVLDDNFERWKLFLHPSQREIVNKNFNGPALIEGGPGTGKTVVGLHRAIYLAKNIYKKEEGKKILLCTFSNKLATYIEDKLWQLTRLNGVQSNIDVKSIDSLIFYLLRRHNINMNFVDHKELSVLFKKLYEEIKPLRSLKFCYIEYKEVTQRHNIKCLSEYLKFNRKGMGTHLNTSARKNLWSFFDSFISTKKKRKLYDFEDRVWILYELVQNGTIKPVYDSIIIDEAQDLSIARISLLTSLLKTKINNLMILSDQNQRIYQLNSWRKDLNIDVVGRTYYLSLNYRTSKEIKEYAEKQFIQTLMIKNHVKKYKSLFGGPMPQAELFDSIEEQYLWISDKIKFLLQEGLSPYEIGIVANKRSEDLIKFLYNQGIETITLKGDIYPNIVTDKVGVTTIHGCKGLEFRAIIIADYQDIYVKKDESSDLEQWYYEKKQKQLECLKYVACTRAREYLAITAID